MASNPCELLYCNVVTNIKLESFNYILFIALSGLFVRDSGAARES